MRPAHDSHRGATPTTVASVNLRFTMSDDRFHSGLRKVLAEQPDLVALQEAGPNRNWILGLFDRYDWRRPDSPNGDPTMPVMWRKNRYQLRGCRTICLARREYVGHLPGRKDRLPSSFATELVLDDLEKPGRRVALLNYHLTAEVQDGADYRGDLAHRLRVMRHKREKRRLGRRARSLVRRGYVVYLAGDTNFEGFHLGGFVSCWDRRTGGTLGSRAVDVILAATRGGPPKTILTPSDHKAVVCTYK